MGLRVAYFVVAIVFAALAVSALLCEHPVPNIEPKASRLTEQSDEKSTASQSQGVKGAAPSGPTVKPGDRQKPANDETNSHIDPVKHWWWFACWLRSIEGQTYFIFLTALFTGLLALYTCQLVAATGFAADAASKNAEAADRQGDILVGIERPWVISVEPKLFWVVPANPKPIKRPWPLPEQLDQPLDIRISFRMRNVGNSPAFLNYFWRTAKPRSVPQPPELPKYGNSRFPPFVIPPKGEHGGELLMRNRSVEELQQIKAGELVIIFWGKIRYESRLGKPETRTTKFCHVWGYDDRGRWFYNPSGPEGWTEYD